MKYLGTSRTRWRASKRCEFKTSAHQLTPALPRQAVLPRTDQRNGTIGLVGWVLQEALAGGSLWWRNCPQNVGPLTQHNIFLLLSGACSSYYVSPWRPRLYEPALHWPLVRPARRLDGPERRHRLPLRYGRRANKLHHALDRAGRPVPSQRGIQRAPES